MPEELIPEVAISPLSMTLTLPAEFPLPPLAPIAMLIEVLPPLELVVLLDDPPLPPPPPTDCAKIPAEFVPEVVIRLEPVVEVKSTLPPDPPDPPSNPNDMPT